MAATLTVWVFMILFIQVLYLIQIVSRKTMHHLTPDEYIAIVIVTIGYSVPAIYEFGWVVLPAFNIGAIK